MTLVTLQEGSSFTFRVVLGAPRSFFCDNTASACDVHLDTVVSPASGGTPIYCPLLDTSITQVGLLHEADRKKEKLKPIFHWNLPLRRLIFAYKQHEIYMKYTWPTPEDPTPPIFHWK